MVDESEGHVDRAKWLPEWEPILQRGSLTKRTIRKDVTVEEGDRGGIQYRSLSRPLDLYVRRGHITRRQYRAGHRYYSLWRHSCLRTRYVRMNYGEEGGFVDVESISLSIKEFLDAQRAIGNVKAREVAFLVCCEDKLAGRTGWMPLLVEALGDLAAHFRIEN